MKKNLFFAIPALIAIVLFSVSCSKSDPTPPTVVNPVGNWVGFQSNGLGGPLSYFAINLQANGARVVSANNSTAPDLANGNWSLVADSVRASFTYAVSGFSYSLAGKYSTTSSVINGTLGTGVSTSGAGVFSVTRQ